MCVAVQTLQLDADPKLPLRDLLCDVRHAGRELESIAGQRINEIELIRSKYKPGSSLRVLYRVKTDSSEMLISARLYAGNSAPVFSVFPNDRKISDLGQISVPCQTYSSFWKSSRIMGYAPEKCVTVACLDANDDVRAYAKLYAGKEFHTAETVARFLQEQQIQGKLRLPKLIALDPANNCIVIEAINGRRLSELNKIDEAAALEKLGSAVAEFHSVMTDLQLPAFSRLSISRIESTAKTIEALRSDCASSAAALSRDLLRLSKPLPEDAVLLHGDIHLKNAVLTDAGLVLIDFDQISYGPAAAEIGSFLAGLHYREVIGEISANERTSFQNAFLNGYDQSGQLPDRDSITWHTAAALFTERANRSITRLRKNGLENFSGLIAAGRRVLTGGTV